MGEGDRVTKPSGGSALGWIRGNTIDIEACSYNNKSGFLAKGFHTDHHKGDGASTYTSGRITKYLGKYMEDVDASGGHPCPPGTPVSLRTPRVFADTRVRVDTLRPCQGPCPGPPPIGSL